MRPYHLQRCSQQGLFVYAFVRHSRDGGFNNARPAPVTIGATLQVSATLTASVVQAAELPVLPTGLIHTFLAAAVICP